MTRMTRRKKADAIVSSSEVAGKLGRLLQTETDLEAMLDEARQQAKKIVDTARQEADAQIHAFEARLDNERQQLHERIEQERDQTIASIRDEAELETRRLAALDDNQLRRIAQDVVDLLLTRFDGEELP